MTTDRDRSPDVPVERVMADLEDLLSPPPLPPHLRASVKQALVERGQTPLSSASHRRRERRVIFAGVVLLAALIGVFGVAAQSGDPTTILIDQAAANAGPERQIIMRYGHKVSASAAACGYTVRIYRAYADANRLNLLYTVSGPAGRHFLEGGDEGSVLKTTQGVWSETLNETTSNGLIGTTGGVYEAFDISKAARHARVLHFTWAIQSLSFAEALPPLGLGATSSTCEASNFEFMYSVGGGFPFVKGSPLLSHLFPWLTGDAYGRKVTVKGPLSLSFSVPVDPVRHVLEPNTTIMAGGHALTLARVVITRSETRIYLRRPTPGHILESVYPELIVDRRNYGSGKALFRDWWQNHAPAIRLYDYGFEGLPFDKKGVWLLTIPSDPSFNLTPRDYPGGPWRFLFRVR